MSESVNANHGRARTARWVAAAAVVVVAAVLAGVVLTHRSSPTSRWWDRFGSTDAAAINQDNQGIAGALGARPRVSAQTLHFDCQIGARDTARVLSQPQPTDPTFRRLYQGALEREALAFRACEAATAASATTSEAVAIDDLRHGMRRFDAAVGAVNARGRALGYGQVFTPAG